MKTWPTFPHKKMRHLPSKPMKKRNSRWHMMLWTSMAVIGWFACKSSSDWVRYLVIVTCTGKSGIFRGQPVSLRGSNLDYSERSASRVKTVKVKLFKMFRLGHAWSMSCILSIEVNCSLVSNKAFFFFFYVMRVLSSLNHFEWLQLFFSYFWPCVWMLLAAGARLF